MAPGSTAVSIRLTEPVLFLTGGTEAERARARRRRAIGTPLRTPANSRPGSRAPSPPPGISAIVEGNYVPPFVAPSPARGAAGRNMSPAPGAAAGGSRSASRTRVTEGTTTGSGSAEEAAAADEPPPALLRGLLTLTLAKPSRIRNISVKLKGVARTDWPEGIGPRRLDVFEETVLISQSWTFFSAANLTNERRAASIGPGVRETGEGDGRGRTGARRSASMMPTREMSVGLAYPSRDSAIHEDDGEVSATIVEQEETFPARSTLSRIPSATQLYEEGAEPPPVQPWEPSPAYEAVNSRQSSPAPGPSGLSRMPSIDLLNPHHGHSHHPRAATPTRSPLGPNAMSIDTSRRPPLRQVYSSDSVTSPSDASHLSQTTSTSEPDHPDDSTRSSFERGRPTTLRPVNGIATNGDSDAATPVAPADEPGRPSVDSSRANVTSLSSAPPPIHPMHRNSSGGSVGPPSVRSLRTSAPPPSRSASSRPSRFSLGALGDALRGKSTSRAREPVDVREQSRGRGRDESPEGRPGDRDQSRGRKTALKVLRDALTSGVDVSTLDSDEEDDEDDKRRDKGWKEFRAGTYTYPISMPIPASLPPSIFSDFGNVVYTLKAVINRAGALTANLTSSVDVMLVSCPGQDDTEESESIVVERFWESQMRYHIALSGKSFPVGGKIPISIRLNPLAKIKLYRITVLLEQRINYFATGRKLTRHETPKKFPLMRIEHADSKEALLPILSDSPDAIKTHPLAAFFINPTSSDDTTPSCLDPIGPWHLESTIQLPKCESRLTFSTAHEKANITVSHLLKIVLRVERGDDDFLDSKGKRKLWDVIIETPIHILSCKCTQNTLPAYSLAAPGGVGPSSAGPSGPSNSFAPAHDCGFNHSHPPPRGVTMAPRTSQSPAPQPATTVEQTLLFARLVAGEITSAGEIPPSYDAIANRNGASMERRSSGSSVATARGRTSSRGGPASAIGSSPGSAPSTSRGRSNSTTTTSRRSPSVASTLGRRE